MRWEELTGDEFPEAVDKAQGVCLLPLSVVERHGHHLPLGTDTYIGRDLCQRTAALEPAVIFPDFIFTQILEARHCAGTISIDAALLLPLLDNVCREIARNGLKKIVLIIAHGCNHHMIRYFLQMQMESARDYVIYVAQPPWPEEDVSFKWDSAVDGHAGEAETSAILSYRPDLVKRDALKADGEGMPQGRLQGLRDMGIETGIWWYADHPTHYRGDGLPATADKGDRWQAGRAEELAKALRLIKQDSETMRLQQEFYAVHPHDIGK
jgi:creatinine amidohydrolase